MSEARRAQRPEAMSPARLRAGGQGFDHPSSNPEGEVATVRPSGESIGSTNHVFGKSMNACMAGAAEAVGARLKGR